MSEEAPSIARRLGRDLLTAAAILWFLIDELVWRRVQASFAWLHDLRLLRRLEHRVQKLPPYGALALFALPGAATFPAKLFALWISVRSPVLGILVLVIAKLVSSGICAWIYRVTKAQLLTIGWFAPLHDKVLAWHEAVVSRLRDAWQRLGLGTLWRSVRTRMREAFSKALSVRAESPERSESAAKQIDRVETDRR